MKKKKNSIYFFIVLNLFSSATLLPITKTRAVKCFVFRKGCTPQEIKIGKELTIKAAAGIGGLALLAAATGISLKALKQKANQTQRLDYSPDKGPTKEELTQAFINVYELAMDKSTLKRIYNELQKQFDTSEQAKTYIKSIYQIQKGKALDDNAFEEL